MEKEIHLPEGFSGKILRPQQGDVLVLRSERPENHFWSKCQDLARRLREEGVRCPVVLVWGSIDAEILSPKKRRHLLRALQRDVPRQGRRMTTEEVRRLLPRVHQPHLWPRPWYVEEDGDRMVIHGSWEDDPAREGERLSFAKDSWPSRDESISPTCSSPPASSETSPT